MRKEHGAVRRHDMLAALECIFDDANSGSQDTDMYRYSPCTGVVMEPGAAYPVIYGQDADVPVSIYNGDLKIKISGLIDIIDKMVI